MGEKYPYKIKVESRVQVKLTTKMHFFPQRAGCQCTGSPSLFSCPQDLVFWRFEDKKWGGGGEGKEKEGKKLLLPRSGNLKTLYINYISDPILDPIVVNNQPLEIVKSAKLLGMNISSDLRWNIHITDIMKKCAPKFYFVRQLKRAHLATSELLTFYLCCIRPVAEYGCQLFHNALPKYLSADLQRIQKRALKIIHPELAYREALAVCNLPTLRERPQKLCDKLFNKVVSNPKHKLHNCYHQETNVKLILGPSEFSM